MENLLINQDSLLTTIAKLRGFKVSGLYDNGVTLERARYKKDIASEQARLSELKLDLRLLLDSKISLKAAIYTTNISIELIK